MDHGRIWNCTGHPWVAVLLACVTVFWGCAAGAAPLSTATEGGEPIGEHIRFLPEQGERLDAAQAARAYAQGKFTPSRKPVLSFGIGAAPAWLAFEVTNPGGGAAVRRLAVETSWIDRIDLYFLRDGRVLDSARAGDTQPFAARPVTSPFFWFDHTFAPGTTTVLLRVETPDPMVLPLYFTSVEAAHARASRQETSYGLLYGFLLALLAYNFMLFLSLKGARYLYYSIYLSCFSIMNVAYTGHGYRWLWPESPVWQQWSNPVLMMVYATSGLLFAAVFLETRRLLPRLHRGVLAGVTTFVVLQAGALLLGSKVASLLLSFVFVFLFSGTMVFLGARAYFAGQRAARYFLLASVTAVIGASITAAAVWGFIPFSAWTYRAVDMGMALDATLLALALADQFRLSQEKRLRAEQLAHVDPLTGINNRRAFTELVAPVWNTERRHRRDMSVLLLDIDRFKSINDAYGHTVGDRVLIQVAEFLRTDMRNGDVVARWGGEEFIVFLPETTLAAACLIAERLRTGISALRFEGAGTHFSCTATFGAAHNDDPDASLDTLISVADRHLYQGKELGRDRVYSG
jgi:diguanylate cyclase (GGDEF)-like protein